ncbi:MAG: crossover junction endodeoxyribonuclease RuvC [Chloroflexi bacterium]|nr:crossover junction endodeoxyribonuclease RuvC [Chloroflexota bacterium]
MRVLGIDPGTATTGFGLVDETERGELVVADYGVIETQAGTPMELRLLELYHKMQELLFLHRPERGAVEKLFFQRNVTTAISVGQARGVILLALAEANIPVAEYAPLEIKMAITGYGVADKKQMQQMVQSLLRMPKLPKPDDAADALAVAICYLHRYRLDDLSLTGGDG